MFEKRFQVYVKEKGLYDGEYNFFFWEIYNWMFLQLVFIYYLLSNVKGDVAIANYTFIIYLLSI